MPYLKTNYLYKKETYRLIQNYLCSETIYKVFLFSVISLVILNFIYIQPIPLFGFDAVGYLGPAMRYHDTGEFISAGCRNIIYPYFVSFFYEEGGGPIPVVIAQRVIFIFALFILSSYLRRIKFIYIMNQGKILNIVYTISYGIILLYVGFNRSIISYVSHIHPESLTVMLTLIYLYSIELFNEWINDKIKTNLILLFMCAYFPLFGMFQPRWILVIPIISIYVFFKLVSLKNYYKAFSFLIIMSLSFFSLNHLNKAYLSNDANCISYTSRVVFASNMNTISKEMNGALREKQAVDEEMVVSALAYFEEAKPSIFPDKTRVYVSGYSNVMKYNVDYILFGGFYNNLYKFMKGDPILVDSFFKKWIMQAVLYHPIDTFLKTAGELLYVYIYMPKFFENSITSYASAVSNAKSITLFWNNEFPGIEQKKLIDLYSYAEKVSFSQKISLDFFIGTICQILNHAYIFCIIIWIYFLVYRMFFSKQIYLIGLTWPLIMSITNNITTSALHFSEPIRYSEDQQILSILIVFFTLISLLKNFVALGSKSNKI